jgi:hypothetical protein
MRDLTAEIITALGGNTFKLSTGVRHATQTGNRVIVTLPPWISARHADFIEIEATPRGTYNLTATTPLGRRATRFVGTAQAVSAADLPALFRELAGLSRAPRPRTNTGRTIPLQGVAS